jgi:hypothetical protein
LVRPQIVSMSSPTLLWPYRHTLSTTPPLQASNRRPSFRRSTKRSAAFGLIERLGLSV